MRKLKLQVQMTVDGYVAGPQGEMDWMALPWTEDINQYVTALTEPVDCIVMGRKLAEGFIPYWAGVAADPSNPEQESGKKFTETQKVVFTRTLERSEWDHTVLAKGELASEIGRLKQSQGGDIIAYGGATFVSSLIREGLVDEYHLFVNPAAISRGLPIFEAMGRTQSLTLQRAVSFDCGIVVLCYQSGVKK